MNPEPDSPPEPVPLAPRPKPEESEATKPVATVDQGRHSGEMTPTPAIEREIPPARVAGGRHLDESLRAVAPKLGIELEELDDWNCCGASVGHIGGGVLPNISLTGRTTKA